MNARYVTITMGIVLTALVLYGCSEKESAFYQGYVEAEVVYLTSSRPGTLKSVFVTKGQSVGRDEPVFQLDANPEAMQIEEMQQRVLQAQARMADIKKGQRPSELSIIESQLTKARDSLALAERDYQRRQDLYQLGSSETISQEELDRYQTEVKLRQADVAAMVAELETARMGGRTDAIAASNSEVHILNASLKLLQWQLEEKQVVAPTAGAIQDIIYRVGEFVPSGRPVLTLLPPENIKIRFFIPQSDLPKTQVGSAVRVTMDGAGAPVTARVSWISPEAEYTPPIIYSKESRSKLVFMIEAVPEVKEMGKLRIGQPVEVSLD